MLSSWVAVGQRDLRTENANSHSKAGTAPSRACNLRLRETKQQDLLGQGQARQDVFWIRTPALHASQCSPGEWRPLGFLYAIRSNVFDPQSISEYQISKKRYRLPYVCSEGNRAELRSLAFPQPAARRFPFGTKLYACKDKQHYLYVK